MEDRQLTRSFPLHSHSIRLSLLVSGCILLSVEFAPFEFLQDPDNRDIVERLDARYLNRFVTICSRIGKLTQEGMRKILNGLLTEQNDRATIDNGIQVHNVPTSTSPS